MNGILVATCTDAMELGKYSFRSEQHQRRRGSFFNHLPTVAEMGSPKLQKKINRIVTFAAERKVLYRLYKNHWSQWSQELSRSILELIETKNSWHWKSQQDRAALLGRDHKQFTKASASFSLLLEVCGSLLCRAFWIWRDFALLLGPNTLEMLSGVGQPWPLMAFQSPKSAFYSHRLLRNNWWERVHTSALPHKITQPLVVCS